MEQVNILGDNTRVVQLPKLVTWPCKLGTPPRLGLSFQPRIEVQEVRRIWNGERTGTGPDGAGTVVIIGPAGVGKTQLAADIFEGPVGLGTDLRIWVKAESRTSVITAFAEASERVQAPVAEDADAEQKSATFLNWLSTTSRTWLVVLDDAKEPLQLSGLWPRGQGCVLVTTYRQDAILLMGSVTTVPLGVFTPDEARSYMERRIQDAGRNGMETRADMLDEVDHLTRDLGFLPVALAQAASVILHQATSCTNYRKDFANRANRLNELFPHEMPADEYGRTVATTWSLAIEEADRTSPRGLAGRMIQLIAATDPLGAPEAIFLAEPSLAFLSGAFLTNKGATSPPSAVTAAEARSALRVLHSLSLIEHQAGMPARVRMHSLTQRAVREATPAPDFQEAEAFVAESLNVAWQATEPDQLASLLSNTEHLISACNDVLWEAGAYGVLFEAGRSMSMAGMHDAAMRHLQWLVGETETWLGADHFDSLAARNELACAHREAGNVPRAIELFEQNMSDVERIRGVYHPDTLTVRNNLASAYRLAGNVMSAVELFEENLSDLERVLGKDDLNTVTARNNLASAYLEVGNVTDAIRLGEGCLADRERLLGKDHPDTLSARNNLALAHQTAGHQDRAVELLEHTLAGLERLGRDHHPNTFAVRNNLATAYQAAGNLLRAAQLFKQAILDLERALGKGHPKTLKVRNNLAATYFAAGNFIRAIKLGEEIVADTEPVLGPDHPDVLTSRNNLAAAYLAAGNFIRAIELFEKIVPDLERVLGKDHPNTLTSRTNLSDAHRKAGNLTVAIKLAERSLADAERVLGKEHPDAMTARHNLAVAYHDGGEFARAIQLHKQALADRERVLGEEHPDTLISRENLATTIAWSGRAFYSLPKKR